VLLLRPPVATTIFKVCESHNFLFLALFPFLLQGRLPIDNKAIDDALENGVTMCLRQLQKTNPSLLLTTLELRKAERDARYVPAVSLALASILTKAVTSPDPTVLERIQRWDTSDAAAAPKIPSNVVTLSDNCSHHSTSHSSVASSNDGREQEKKLSTKSVESLGLLIEERLRLVLAQSEKKKTKPAAATSAKQPKTENDVDQEGKENETSVASSQELSVDEIDVDWDLLQQQFEQEKEQSNKPSAEQGTTRRAGGSNLDGGDDSEDDFEDWL